MRFLYAIMFVLLLVSQFSFATGSVTVSRTNRAYGLAGGKYTQVVNIDWVADSADGSVPTTSVPLFGYTVKIITNPGATAPTANYDIAFGDPEDNNLDALASALQNRHTSTTEQVYPMIAGAPGTVSAHPVFLAGTYAVSVSNNSVNSATGRIQVYLTDQP